MKILYIVNSTNMSGGATKSFMTMILGLKGMGVEPHVVTPDKEGLYNILKDLGVAVLQLNYRMNVYPDFVSLKDKILFLPRLICRRGMECIATSRIIDYCKTNSIEAIHTNVSIISCGLSAAKKLKIPHILHIREYVDWDFGYKPYPSKKSFYRNIIGKNKYVICITKGIQKHHNLSSQNSQVIYNGIAAVSVPPAENHISNYFLFVGRIEPSKGAIDTLKAYKLFCEQNPTNSTLLKMAGEFSDYNYLKKVQSYILENRLERRVELLGNRDDINNLMQSAMATIIASYFEAFGRCLPESMLNGCLTIGRNTGGTKEQYDNGVELFGKEIGLRFNTVEELATCLKKVATEPSSSFDEMRNIARKTVYKLYDEIVYVNNIYSLYKTILSNTLAK